ncbi:hypothetical protein AB6A40_008874 [Gnathostoma spinigerum]|uniref:Glutathione S-transferase 1 n=1 Tax=Gnathostoma spinigerum TaxID=75299 RepID=A0ABD6ERI7_9BILA
MSYKLRYFPVRARGECIRLLFHYTETKFDDEIISFEDWPAIKPTTPFGQVPVLIVGGRLHIAQTTAILRYIGEKKGLIGRNAEENALIDMYGEQIQDALNATGPYVQALYFGKGDPVIYS